MKIIIGALVVLFVGYIFLWKLPANGWHRETGRGEHVGYVTAVEKVGIFFKKPSEKVFKQRLIA